MEPVLIGYNHTRKWREHTSNPVQSVLEVLEGLPGFLKFGLIGSQHGKTKLSPHLTLSAEGLRRTYDTLTPRISKHYDAVEAPPANRLRCAAQLISKLFHKTLKQSIKGSSILGQVVECYSVHLPKRSISVSLRYLYLN